MTQTTIALRKGMILFPANFGAGCGDQVAATIQAELMQLGYMLDREAFALMGDSKREFAIEWHNEVIPYIKKMLGADRNYAPFYRNFPTDVMEMSELQLFINAIVHYWSNGTWEPPQTIKDRGMAFENVTFKVIKTGDDAKFNRIFTNLVSLNQSLTEEDKEIVAWFVDHRKVELPKAIPFKETLCILEGLDVPVMNPTDVLRIAVYLSGGDISLPALPSVPATPKSSMRTWYYEHQKQAAVSARDAFKFKKFTRAERRRLMGLLEKSNPLAAEMRPREGRWLRLGERLHPGEFAAKCPLSFAAFKALREQPAGKQMREAKESRTRVRTFMSRVNLALAQDFRQGVDVLSSKPGEFVRRLDWLLREPKAKATAEAKSGSNILGDLAVKFGATETETSPVTLPLAERQAYVLDTFHRVGHKVSAKVLFELWNHFEGRTRVGAPRSIMIKGARSKQKRLEPLPPMDRALVDTVRSKVTSTIRTRIAALAPLGKVYVDPRLKDVPLPFSMRSMNAGVKTYVRGTKVPYSADAKVIRAFIHWFDENGSIDLDLSGQFFDENMNVQGHASFTALKDYGCYHSGDIRHRRGPCAEYIDMEIDVLLKRKIRYVAMQVNNYNGKPMHSVKDCVFGLMPREFPKANEIFVPKTISDCMGMANESSTITICIIDLKERNYIWTDIESSGGFATIESQSGGTMTVMQSFIHSPKMSIYDLLKMHAEERGQLVDSAEGADKALLWDNFVTDYAAVGEYMNA